MAASLSRVAQPVSGGRFTRLERVVMDALAHDLRADVPDLAAQFEDSRASQRRNTGFGLFTEMIVARDRPAPPASPTGDLGTVHIMVGALPDPIAFKARLRNGVLLGLLGDSYGQDTRAIDFATVPFDCVFTLDAQGRSIEYDPAPHRVSAPLLDLHRQAEPPRPAPVPPALVNRGALQRVQDPPVSPSARDMAASGLLDVAAPGIAMPTDRTGLLIAAWTVLVVLAFFAVVLFGVPWIFAIIAVVWIGSVLRRPKVLDALVRGAEAWNARRPAQAAVRSLQNR